MIKFGEDTITMVLQQKRNDRRDDPPIVFCLGINPSIIPFNYLANSHEWNQTK